MTPASDLVVDIGNRFSVWIAFQTIVVKEIRRFSRIWVQTLLPPAITMVLYFVIFGHLMGNRLGNMGGHSYVQFIVPGLIMMAVITNSYANVVSSFFGNKFQRSIEELLVSPTPDWIILLGYVVGGIARGMAVGIIVMLLSLVFTGFMLQHLWATLLVVLLTAGLFSILGFINALFAKKFDDISIVPTFILTPLTYFGGVFYAIEVLPAIWQKLSLLNPIVYMVDAFRYGLLGSNQFNVGYSLLMMTVLNIALFMCALYLLKKGTGLKA
jgi:ABC-2 type transport system permease protein